MGKPVLRKYEDLNKIEKQEVDKFLLTLVVSLREEHLLESLVNPDENGWGLLEVTYKNAKIICKVNINDL